MHKQNISVIDASAEHKPTPDENIPVKPLPITISDLLSLGKKPLSLILDVLRATLRRHTIARRIANNVLERCLLQHCHAYALRFSVYPTEG